MKEPVSSPPQWILRMLQSLCPDHLWEEIEGDLIQRFYRDVDTHGEKKARRRFVWNTLCFFRPGIIFRGKRSYSFIPMFMIANYVKVSSRVMLRNKPFSLINISGLALGITSAILLFLWIGKEFSYDQFHRDKDRIYKAWNRAVIEGELQCWDITPRILAPTLKEEYAAVERAVSYAAYGSPYLFTVGKTRLINPAGAFTDPEFLTMFSFPLIKGDVAHALNAPESIVLTESFARRLFGDQEPFGETVTISDSGYDFSFTVTGILKDLPSNTDFHFEYLIPFHFLEALEGKETYWGNNSLSTYVRLKDGADITTFNETVKDIAKRHTNDGDNREIFLYPLTKMHLYSRFENGIPAGGRIDVMRMIGILGICLVVIACINFINLSTARAQKRSKEVGVRKVTGAYRHALIAQFLCESVLLAVVAGIISLGAVYLLLPLFNELVQQQLTMDFLNLPFWLSVLLIIVLIGILAGSYPALYLSSFHPVRVLKGAVIQSSGRNMFRKTLVVFQFGFAITLIFSTIIIRKQIVYVQNREAGYNKNNLIYHDINGDLSKNYEAYRNELLQRGVAESVTKTGSPITQAWSSTYNMAWRDKDPQSKIAVERFYADRGLIKTAGLTLVTGRDIDLEHFPSDSTAVLLNEAAVRTMGFEDPIGEIIKDDQQEYHVVGVVKDFVLNSPYEKIKPMVLLGRGGWSSVVHIRLNPHNPVQQNLAQISKLFSKYNPAYPFDYHFVDVVYARKFASLEKTLTITSLFSFIVIFIACLGLFGLSMYLIEAKIKEIGVRKVLGGSVVSITRLLCMHSLKPILLAIVLFSPGAWLAMDWWLQFSEYRISLDIWTLLIAAAVLLFMAMITIGVQTIHAAKLNPVDSLRAE